MIKPKHNWKGCFWYSWNRHNWTHVAAFVDWKPVMEHGPCCCSSDSLLVGAPVRRVVGFREDSVNLLLLCSPGEDPQRMKKRKWRKLRDEEKKWWETAKWREEETLHKRITKRWFRSFAQPLLLVLSPYCSPSSSFVSPSFCPVLHSVWVWGVLLLWNIPLCCRLQIWDSTVFISVSDCFYLCIVACLFQSDSSTCLTLSSFDS